jgi:FKBP-type peptidyl-prolyl cis-trans isomerase SlyD
VSADFRKIPTVNIVQIENNKVVTLNYTLKDNDGNILDKSDDGTFVYLHGAMNIIPGLENALAGKASGDDLSVSVSPEEGYGVRDDSRVQQVPKNMFENGSDIQVGMQFHAQGQNGEVLVVTVADVLEDEVVVDANHPLAGKELNFDVTVVEIRDASAEELEHGHVHGPGGHQH